MDLRFIDYPRVNLLDQLIEAYPDCLTIIRESPEQSAYTSVIIAEKSLPQPLTVRLIIGMQLLSILSILSIRSTDAGN